MAYDIRTLSLNGEPRHVRVSPGAPEVTDDFGCSWPVAEFDVSLPAESEPTESAPDPAPEVAAPTKRPRKPKVEHVVEELVIPVGPEPQE